METEPQVYADKIKAVYSATLLMIEDLKNNTSQENIPSPERNSTFIFSGKRPNQEVKNGK